MSAGDGAGWMVAALVILPIVVGLLIVLLASLRTTRRGRDDHEGDEPRDP